MTDQAKAPELIICRDAAQADRVERQIGCDPRVRVVVADHLMGLGSRTFAKVIVCEGVDLNYDAHGQGRLIDLIQMRQRTWGHQASIIAL